MAKVGELWIKLRYLILDFTIASKLQIRISRRHVSRLTSALSYASAINVNFFDVQQSLGWFAELTL